MKNRIKQLKVKIKSLAAEARIIRLETHRTNDIVTKNDLATHRTGIVREEARYSQLAYAFLRGRSYASIEAKTEKELDLARVRKLVERFGVTRSWDEPYKDYDLRKKEQEKELLLWIENAKAHLNERSRKAA